MATQHDSKQVQTGTFSTESGSTTTSIATTAIGDSSAQNARSGQFHYVTGVEEPDYNYEGDINYHAAIWTDDQGVVHGETWRSGETVRVHVLYADVVETDPHDEPRTPIGGYPIYPVNNQPQTTGGAPVNPKPITISLADLGITEEDYIAGVLDGIDRGEIDLGSVSKELQRLWADRARARSNDKAGLAQSRSAIQQGLRDLQLGKYGPRSDQRSTPSSGNGEYYVAGTLFVAGFIPGVGEAIDLAVLLDPSSSGLNKAAAAASLGINILTGGFAPNFGAALRGSSKIGTKIDDAAEFGGTVAARVEAPSNPAGTYRPARELPRNKNGVPTPDSQYPHTQLGTREGRKGTYTQGREWDYDSNGKLRPIRDTDFTDHGRPGNHANPHQHYWLPNPTGGSPYHGPAVPLQ